MNKSAISHESLRILISRFLDGSTTPTEEQKIYSSFSHTAAGSLPPDLEAQRAMFAWYAGLSQKESAAKKRRKSGWVRYAAAAVVATMICLGFLTHPVKFNSEQENLYAQYSGSYIVRNGQRITDIETILVSVMRAEHLADSLEEVARKREDAANMDYGRASLEESVAAIPDSDLAGQLLQDFL